MLTLLCQGDNSHRKHAPCPPGTTRFPRGRVGLEGLPYFRKNSSLPNSTVNNGEHMRKLPQKTLASFAITSILACAACTWAPDRVVQEPNKISLQSALVDTVDALNAAYDRSHSGGRRPVGFYPCTLSATFNISATGTADNKLAVGVSGGMSGATINASASNENTLTAARGNVVVATFASSLCLPADDAKATKAAKRASRGLPLPPVELFRRVPPNFLQ
jgi:hypothetical protein